MLPEQVRHLHFEITTRCNAHCFACARNNSGFGLKKGLELLDLPTEIFADIVSKFPNLEIVQLCGIHGDPIASTTFADIVDHCVNKGLEIHINTNGSLKTLSWWETLATKLSAVRHKVVFGIDGLEGIHEMHRQGTNFNKIIENAQAFINKGGCAQWQFLLFEHNKHQVKDCMKLSQKMGFMKFSTLNSILPKNGLARNYLTGETYLVQKVSGVARVTEDDLTGKTVEVEDCNHVHPSSLYVGADGVISPCCYMEGIPWETSTVYEEITSGNANDHCRMWCGKRRPNKI